jgi:hypothetical protein
MKEDLSELVEYLDSCFVTIEKELKGFRREVRQELTIVNTPEKLEEGDRSLLGAVDGYMKQGRDLLPRDAGPRSQDRPTHERWHPGHRQGRDQAGALGVAADPRHYLVVFDRPIDIETWFVLLDNFMANMKAGGLTVEDFGTRTNFDREVLRSYGTRDHFEGFIFGDDARRWTVIAREFFKSQHIAISRIE